MADSFEKKGSTEWEMNSMTASFNESNPSLSEALSVFLHLGKAQTQYIFEVFIQHNKIRLFIIWVLIRMYQNFIRQPK